MLKRSELMASRKAQRFVSVLDLVNYLKLNGLNCSLNSRQHMVLLQKSLKGSIQLRTFVLAALFAGFSVLPIEGGNNFVFRQANQ